MNVGDISIQDFAESNPELFMAIVNSAQMLQCAGYTFDDKSTIEDYFRAEMSFGFEMMEQQAEYDRLVEEQKYLDHMYDEDFSADDKSPEYPLNPEFEAAEESRCPKCGSYEGDYQECPECGHGQ